MASSGVFELPDGRSLFRDGRPARRLPGGGLEVWSPSVALRTAQQVDHTVSLLRSPNLADLLRFAQIRFASSMGLGLRPELREGSPELVFETRVRLARTLADADRSDAHLGWIETLPLLQDPALRERMVRDGRDSRRLRRTVAAQLHQGNPLALRAAGWLGGRDLDEGLRRWVRREPEALATVVAALALPAHRPERTGLVLDLWSDLVVRGAVDDDVATASRLFGSLGADTAQQLVDVAMHSHHRVQRELALVGLAGCRDPRALDALETLLSGSHQEMSALAALALGHLPARVLGHLERAAAEPDAWHLRAALACAGAPVVTPWLDAMELTLEERAFLAAGRFDRAQFPIAVSLFKERALTGY